MLFWGFFGRKKIRWIDLKIAKDFRRHFVKLTCSSGTCELFRLFWVCLLFSEFIISQHLLYHIWWTGLLHIQYAFNFCMFPKKKTPAATSIVYWPFRGWVHGESVTWRIHPAWMHHRKVNDRTGFGPLLCQHHLLSLRRNSTLLAIVFLSLQYPSHYCECIVPSPPPLLSVQSCETDVK